jgi:hypothetical protein
MSPAGRGREQIAYVRGRYAYAARVPARHDGPTRQVLPAIAPGPGPAGSFAPPDAATALGCDIAAALEDPDGR